MIYFSRWGKSIKTFTLGYINEPSQNLTRGVKKIARLQLAAIAIYLFYAMHYILCIHYMHSILCISSHELYIIKCFMIFILYILCCAFKSIHLVLNILLYAHHSETLIYSSNSLLLLLLIAFHALCILFYASLQLILLIHCISFSASIVCRFSFFAAHSMHSII